MTSEDRAYLDEQFGAIKEQFGAVDRRFDGIDQRLDGMDRRLDGVEARLSGEIHALGVDLEDKYQNVKLLAEQFPTLQRVTNDKIDDLRTELLDLIVPIGQAVRHHFKAR